MHQQSDKTYGSPRVHRELVAQGIACSKKRVERIMSKYAVRAETPRRFVVTTDSTHALPVRQNLCQCARIFWIAGSQQTLRYHLRLDG